MCSFRVSIAKSDELENGKARKYDILRRQHILLENSLFQPKTYSFIAF